MNTKSLPEIKNTTVNELNDLIDLNGSSIYHAAKSLRKCIARRASEGKESPVAAAKLAALLELPVGYKTPKMISAAANRMASGGYCD